MEVALYPNFDYEFELAKVPPCTLRTEVVKRFEWLALLELEEGSLLLQKDYAPEYLAHLSRFKSLPHIVKHATHLKNWWGPLENLELELQLNSKLFAAQLARDLLGFEFDLLYAGDSLKDGWLAKREFSVSGRGIITDRKAREIKEAKFTEPFYKRTLDVGSRYRFMNEQWVLTERSINEIDERFNFRGAKLSAQMNFDKDFTEHDRDQLKVLQALKERFGDQLTEIQMDSFFYLDTHHEERPRALCEFNYRKSVVSVLYRFLSLIGREEAIWLMRPIKPLGLKSWLELVAITKDHDSIVLSAPEGRDLGILVKQQQSLEKLRSELFNKLAIEL